MKDSFPIKHIMHHSYFIRFAATVVVLACAFHSQAAELKGRLTFSGNQHLPARIYAVKNGMWQIASPLFDGYANVPQSLVRNVHFDGLQKIDTAGLFRFELLSGEVLVGRLLSLDSESCTIEHFDLGVVVIRNQQLAGLSRVTKNQQVVTAVDLPVGDEKVSVSKLGAIKLAQNGRFKIPFDASEGSAVSTMFGVQSDTSFRMLVKAEGKTIATLHVSADGLMSETDGSLDFAEVEINLGVEQLTCVFAKQRMSIRTQSGVEVLDFACKCEVAPSIEIVGDSNTLEILQTRIDAAHKPAKIDPNQAGEIVITDKQGQTYGSKELTIKDRNIVFSGNQISIDDLQSIQFLKRARAREKSPSAVVLWADGSRMAVERLQTKDSRLFIKCEKETKKNWAEVSSPQAVCFPGAKPTPTVQKGHKLTLADSSYTGTFRWGDAKQPLRWQFDGFKKPVALKMNRKIIVSDFASVQSLDLKGLDRLILANGTILPCRISSIDKTSVNFQSPYCETQTIPVDQFRACFFSTRFDSGNANTVTTESLQRMLTIPRFSRDLEPEHVLISGSGDLLRGTLESLGEKHVAFDSRAELLRIDRQRISGIVRFSDQEMDDENSKDAVAANSVAINFGDDFVVVGEVQNSDAMLQVNVPGIGVCRLPKQAKSLQVNADRNSLSSLNRYANLSLASSMDPRWTEPPPANVDAEQTKGKPAPDFELSTLDGKPFRLSDHRGKVIVLDFWATWCQPCLTGMPEYLQVIQEFSAGEVLFAAVNVGETGSKVEKFQEEKQWDTNLLLDAQSQVANQYSATAIPHLVVIDPQGNVAEVSIGYSPKSASKLKQQIQGLLSGDTN